MAFGIDDALFAMLLRQAAKAGLSLIDYLRSEGVELSDEDMDEIQAKADAAAARFNALLDGD